MTGPIKVKGSGIILRVFSCGLLGPSQLAPCCICGLIVEMVLKLGSVCFHLSEIQASKLAPMVLFKSLIRTQNWIKLR